LYETLEVTKSAKPDEIESAYRTLAFRYHPTRHRDKKQEVETKFRNLALAYEILSNENYKQIYDSQGFSAVGIKSTSPFDTFKRVFGPNFDMDAIFYPDYEAVSRRYPIDPPMETDIPCTLEQLYFGGTKIIENTRSIYHQDGSRIDQEIRRFRINLVPGWRKGTKIKFHNEGDVYPGRIPADQIFVIQEIPHNIFTREGSNLILTHTLSLRAALLGPKIKFIWFDGKEKIVSIHPRVVYPEYVHRLVGEGMPKTKTPGEHGDLLIKFNILFPDNLNEEQRESVARVLDDKKITWRPIDEIIL